MVSFHFQVYMQKRPIPSAICNADPEEVAVASSLFPFYYYFCLWPKGAVLNHSVVSDSLQPHGL